MAQTCGRGLSVFGGGKLGAAFAVLLLMDAVCVSKQTQKEMTYRVVECWRISSLKGTGGAGLSACSGSGGISQLSASLELLLLLVATTEPDMVVDERDTLAPESFITMAKAVLLGKGEFGNGVWRRVCLARAG